MEVGGIERGERLVRNALDHHRARGDQASPCFERSGARENDVAVNQTLHFDNLHMIKEAVALGSGVSIVPARVLHAELELGRIVAVPLAAPGLERPLGIIYRRRKKFNRATQAFLDLLQEVPAAEMIPSEA